MRVLGIAGSLRRDSYNARLLETAAGRVPDGVELQLWRGLKEVPPFDEDDEGGALPDAVADLRTAIADADAVLFATPEYNSSVPGQLKNALDWISRPYATSPLRNKPVAVVGASTGPFGAVFAQADLRRIVARIGARVVETELPVPHVHERFDEDGRLVDEQLGERLEGALALLIDHVRARQLAAA